MFAQTSEYLFYLTPTEFQKFYIILEKSVSKNLKNKQIYPKLIPLGHRLQTPNEGMNQRYLKNWANVADKICFGCT